ncbi:hypothetical protein BCU68_12405 [Vibrio sp. 10N.286.49.B3]|uniref:hypothetical protein n=1 Tax=Vibrio sp. 10N.286.49.B3 TaxID=1880855 RepID=UPI000C82448F|nr:hypothetical protein [Vibrio sp. 10N.286.49.B3]PMH44643.1 hypothetical protein BCU68_12405 [Vibrio sp. 10N.286.49.B3]
MFKIPYPVRNLLLASFLFLLINIVFHYLHSFGLFRAVFASVGLSLEVLCWPGSIMYKSIFYLAVLGLFFFIGKYLIKRTKLWSLEFYSYCKNKSGQKVALFFGGASFFALLFSSALCAREVFINLLLALIQNGDFYNHQIMESRGFYDLLTHPILTALFALFSYVTAYIMLKRLEWGSIFKQASNNDQAIKVVKSSGKKVRKSTIALIVGTVVYLVFEISFNLHLLEIIALDRLHFYENVDKIGRLLSGIGISLIVIKAWRYRLTTQGKLHAGQLFFYSVPTFAVIIAVVYYGQEKFVDEIAKQTYHQHKIAVIENFMHAKYHQVQLLKEDNEGIDGNYSSKAIIQSALAPFLVVSGIADFSLETGNLSQSERIKQMTEVARFELSNNYDLYTRSNFAKGALPRPHYENHLELQKLYQDRTRNAEAIKKFDKPRHFFNLTMLDALYMQSWMANMAYLNLEPARLAKRQQAAYLEYRTPYREFIAKNPKMSDSRITSIMLRELSKRGVRISNWNHKQVTRAKNAIYDKVAREVKAESIRTLRSLGVSLVDTKSRNPLRHPDVQASLITATKGWNFTSATEERLTTIRVSRDQVMALAPSIARYNVENSSHNLTMKYRALLAPTLAVFISFVLICINLFNIYWSIKLDRAGIYNEEVGKRAKWRTLGFIAITVLVLGFVTGSFNYVRILFVASDNIGVLGYLCVVPLMIMATLIECIYQLRDIAIPMYDYIGYTKLSDLENVYRFFYQVDGVRVADPRQSRSIFAGLKDFYGASINFLKVALPLAVLLAYISLKNSKEAELYKAY